MKEFKFTYNSQYIKHPWDSTIRNKYLVGYFITVFAIDRLHANLIHNKFYDQHISSWTGMKYSKCIERAQVLDRRFRNPTLEFAILNESGENWIRTPYGF